MDIIWTVYLLHVSLYKPIQIVSFGFSFTYYIAKKKKLLEEYPISQKNQGRTVRGIDR